MFMKILTKSLLLFALATLASISYSSRLRTNRKSHAIPIRINFDKKIDHEDYMKFYVKSVNKFNEADSKLTSLLYNSIAERKDAACIAAPIKSPESLERKISTQFHPNIAGSRKYYDFEEITDIIRASIVFKSESAIYEYLNIFKDKVNKDFKFKDRLKDRKVHQYRDINISLQSDVTLPRDKGLNTSSLESTQFKIPMEVQLHLCGIFLANKILHFTYEARRLLRFYDGNLNAMLEITETSKNEFNEILKKNYKLAEIIGDNALKKALLEFSEELTQNKVKNLMNQLLVIDNIINEAASKPEVQAKCFELLSQAMDNPKSCSAGKDKLIVASKAFLKEISPRLKESS